MTVTTLSHDKNVPEGTFLQDAQYVAPCTFRDIFDVKCPLSGTTEKACFIRRVKYMEL